MDIATVSQSAVAHPPPQPLTWGPAEVAAALGLTEASFRARRPDLEAAGFPLRLPVLRGRWSVEAVKSWVALAGLRDDVAPNGEGRA